MEQPRKLSILTKSFFGAGEIPGTTSKTMMGLLFMYFLTDVVGLLPALAGTVFMLGRIWDAVTDPSMGIITDRTRTRFGRRRPFFLVAAIPLGLFFFLMFNSFPLETQGGKMAVYTVLYILYMTAITTFVVPYLGLMAELTDDYTERTSVNNYRMFFSFIFGLTAAVLPKMLIDSYHDKELGFTIAALCVGIFIAIIPVIVFFTTSERYTATPRKKGLNVFREFKTAFTNKSFLTVLIVYVGSFAAINAIEGFVVYYMKYWIMREKEMPILFVSVILSAVVTLPLWSILSRKIGKKYTVVFGAIFWIFSLFLWLIVDSSHPAYYVYIVGLLNGVGYGCLHTMPWAMLPDALDEDELNTGERREGIFAGIMTFFMKIGNSLAMFLIGVTLQAVGYRPNEVQTGLALETMRLIMAFGPMVFLFPSLAAAFFFPITREKYMEIRERLEKLKK